MLKCDSSDSNFRKLFFFLWHIDGFYYLCFFSKRSCLGIFFSKFADFFIFLTQFQNFLLYLQRELGCREDYSLCYRKQHITDC